MKKFVRTYYFPILSDIDFLKLEETYVEKIEQGEESPEAKIVKRDLSRPKQDSCSRIAAVRQDAVDELRRLSRYEVSKLNEPERIEHRMSYEQKRF